MDLKALGLQKIKFTPDGRVGNIISKEGDIGTRGLLVEFKEGLDCMFYAEDREGEIHEVIADEVEEGLYEIIFPLAILKKGKIPAEIKFKKDGEILSTFMFSIEVLKSLFSLRNGIIIVGETNLADEPIIPTTVEGDFEVDGEFGRNLFTDSDKGYVPPWSAWDNRTLENSVNIVDGIETGIITINKRTNGAVNAIHRRYNDFLVDKEYTLSLFARINQSSDIEESTIDIFINRYVRFGITKEWARVSATQSVALTSNTIHIKQNNAEIPVDVALFKLEKGDPTPYSPAPEDLSNLKGKQYNLSTLLKKDQWYILSISGDFTEDDFIGVWLGKDKFVGYLVDNKITFRPNQDYGDTDIIIKTLSEKGKIEWLSIKEG